jgi:MoaA/NifB/PqqE/SkfB family radical SAM enzyme
VRITAHRAAALAGRGAVSYILGRPFCVSFEVTRCCNARCKHCHLHGAIEEERAAPDVYGRLCDELKPVVAQVSGGEPLLRRDLERIIEALVTRGGAPYVVLTTNAVTLSKERFASLRRAGVDEFSISLDYPDERHDAFRGVDGLFHRVESLVTALSREERSYITLGCVVQSDNFRDLVRMAELAHRWNARVNFSTYTRLRTNDESYLLSAQEVAELREVISRLLDFRRRHGVVHTSEHVFQQMVKFFKHGRLQNCRTGSKFLVVNPEGTLSPCGLVLRSYSSAEELRDDFSKDNTCGQCYTGIRANSEKPVKNLVLDNLRTV